MNWNEGYTAQYYLTIVDPYTWRDVQTVDIVSGTITKNASGLMESASIELTENLGEQFVRVYINAQQGGDGERAAIYTGLLQTPKVEWDGRRGTYEAECYSVLKPAADILLPRGWYAGSGQSAAAVARDLLAIIAPVVVDGTSPKLSQNIIAEDGETNLSMASRIIDSIGWRIRISGYGTITICERPLEAVERLDSNTNDIVELRVTDAQDLFNCPNVFRAISGDQIEEVRDETAITARGREVWAEDSRSVLNDGESLKEYAKRKLAELQSPSRVVEYDRRFLPDIVPGDLVELHLPGQQIAGLFKIAKQSIALGYNATVSEEAHEYQ